MLVLAPEVEKFRIRENRPLPQTHLEASWAPRSALHAPLTASLLALPGRRRRRSSAMRRPCMLPPGDCGRHAREHHVGLCCIIGACRSHGTWKGTRLQRREWSIGGMNSARTRQLLACMCPRVSQPALCICGGRSARAWLSLCHRSRARRGLCMTFAYRRDQHRDAERLRMLAHAVA